MRGLDGGFFQADFICSRPPKVVLLGNTVLVDDLEGALN